ncbi:MAG: hypothetical protein ACJ762_00745 [Solirubrobacteraceae bacterium]
MIRRLLTAAVLAALLGGSADARTTPPRQATWKPAEKQQRTEQRRALARRQAAARREALATRRELAAAQALLAPVTATAPAVVPAPVVTPSVPVPADLGHTVGITARDTPSFFLQLSRLDLAAGVVKVQVQNAGEDGHDVHIEPVGGLLLAAWDEIASGGAPAEKDIVMTPGVYRVYCSLPGHAAAGMDTQLTVWAG